MENKEGFGFGFYDPNTDTIWAKKDTLTYYHEEAHRNWFKKGIEQSLQSISFIIISVAIFSYGFTFKDLGMKFLFSIPAFFILISEFHAWMFAFRKAIKLKKLKGKK